VIKIEEAEPKALLSIKKRLYLIDGDGSILERIEGETVPFIPVIKNINTKNRKGMSEALKLVAVLTRENDFIDSESIEIGLESYGLTVKIDGEFMKVGYGRYSEKFERWLELEPEIRKRGVPIKYVDLRFKDSVIIKPMRETKGEKSS
jgi:cell division septal protein FtsQ